MDKNIENHDGYVIQNKIILDDCEVVMGYSDTEQVPYMTWLRNSQTDDYFSGRSFFSRGDALNDMFERGMNTAGLDIKKESHIGKVLSDIEHALLDSFPPEQVSSLMKNEVFVEMAAEAYDKIECRAHDIMLGQRLKDLYNSMASKGLFIPIFISDFIDGKKCSVTLNSGQIYTGIFCPLSSREEFHLFTSDSSSDIKIPFSQICSIMHDGIMFYEKGKDINVFTGELTLYDKEHSLTATAFASNLSFLKNLFIEKVLQHTKENGIIGSCGYCLKVSRNGNLIGIEQSYMDVDYKKNKCTGFFRIFEDYKGISRDNSRKSELDKRIDEADMICEDRNHIVQKNHHKGKYR